MADLGLHGTPERKAGESELDHPPEGSTVVA